MLPEAGAFELVFLAAVALIVVGPKDLPILLRKVGQFTSRMRGLANEFRASFDEMARQSELDELRREVDALRNGRLSESVVPQIEGHFREINDHLTDVAQQAAYGTSAISEPPASEGKVADSAPGVAHTPPLHAEAVESE